MKTTAVVLFVACIVGTSLAQDCSAKIKDFHKCLEDSNKKAREDGKAKFEALKGKIDACYTDNGCTPPVKAEKGKGGSSGSSGSASGEKQSSGERQGNNTQARECKKAVREALKKQLEECVKKTDSSFTLPEKDGSHEKHGPHGGFGHNRKGDNKNLEGCAKKEQVRDCKRALFNSSKPTEDEKRARFQARCDAKQSCQNALGADCQAQLEKRKQAICQCRQEEKQQVEQVRSGIQACNGLPQKQHKRGQGQKQQSCDKKDYCKLGFDAFEQEVKSHFGGKSGGHHH